MNDHERKMTAVAALREAAHLMITRFLWGDTPEGAGYWHEQYAHLTALATQLESHPDETVEN